MNGAILKIIKLSWGLPVIIELNPCILSSMGNDNFLFCLLSYHHTLNSTIKSDTFTQYKAYILEQHWL